MKTPSVCVLASGGLDSAVLLGRALQRHKNVYPLYVRCGLRWERAELHWLRKYLRALHRPGLRPLAVLDMPSTDIYGRHWSVTGRRVPGYTSRDKTVYLPGRNILILAKAAVFCAQNDIPLLQLGVLKGNPFPDASPAFFKGMQTALSRGLRFSLRIEAPFQERTKRQVLALGRGLPLHLAFSCLRPLGLNPCGDCNKCAELEKVKNLLS